MERSAGILLHFSSLPSNYGIGTLGDEAYRFADMLRAAGQKWWQVLPIGQTGYGDSPYQSVSVFAGNPYFIDLDMLAQDGLIPKSVMLALCEKYKDADARFVDYGDIYSVRFDILRIAYKTGYSRDLPKVKIFECENKHWINDYSLFMACKKHFGMKPYREWEDKLIAEHTKEGVEKYNELLYDDVCFYTYIQYLFFKQYALMKAYANSVGVSILGDIPIYVAPDSCDAWAHPENYLLDKDGRPSFVAGVPPDYFSEDGQLWGNPIYDWEYMKSKKYSWWLSRFEMASKLFDAVRIDHFRGLSSYWCVPYGDENAKGGHWQSGPGIDLIRAVKRKFPALQIIAEDLGVLTPDVTELLEKSKLPGMRVLQFAFYDGQHSSYMPHNFEKNTVCYTGTHDNDTLAGYFESMKKADFEYVKRYIGLNEDEGYVFGVIRSGMSSIADLFIAQMQDYLELGTECRMNMPGRAAGNWSFRMKFEEFNEELIEKIKKMTEIYQR